MKKLFVVLFLLVIGSFAFSQGTTENGSGTSSVTYPTKNVDVYVGHGAGGGTDNFVRIVTGLMAKDLGTSFTVINQPGGSGVVAMKNAMTKKADGYSIIGDSAYSVTNALGTNPYTLDQVIPICRCQSDIYALQVKKGKFASIDDLVAAAKANPDTLTIAAVGSMGMDEITARRFLKYAGIGMRYIPEEGAGTMHSDLLGGHVDVMLEEVGPVVSYVQSGDFVPLVFFAEKRLDDFPNVPTSVEKGWNITEGIERYLMCSADTPKEIVKILEESAHKAVQTKEYMDYAHNSYLDLRDGWMGSEDFKKVLEQEIKDYKTILADL